MPSFHNLLKSLLCLVLFGILSGCTALDVVTVAMIPSPDADPYSHRTGKNHYEPIILTSHEDMIKIRYLSVGPNAEHEEVIQLIFDHCDGAYIETNRVELRGYTTVDAECNHDAESWQRSSAIGRGCVITRYLPSFACSDHIRCLVLGFEGVCSGWDGLLGGLFRCPEGTETAHKCDI